MLKYSLDEVLLLHRERYPLLEPQDYIKLIYQNEFGPGHMIVDPDMVLKRLFDEAQSLVPVARYPFDPIGNGLIRVHINGLSEDRLMALGAAFVATANSHRGRDESFIKKLNRLRVLFPNDTSLDEFITGYLESGIRPIHHSHVYSENYNPAYRVVSEQLFKVKE